MVCPKRHKEPLPRAVPPASGPGPKNHTPTACLFLEASRPSNHILLTPPHLLFRAPRDFPAALPGVPSHQHLEVFGEVGVALDYSSPRPLPDVCGSQAALSCPCNPSRSPQPLPSLRRLPRLPARLSSPPSGVHTAQSSALNPHPAPRGSPACPAHLLPPKCLRGLPSGLCCVPREERPLPWQHPQNGRGWPLLPSGALGCGRGALTPAEPGLPPAPMPLEWDPRE